MSDVGLWDLHELHRLHGLHELHAVGQGIVVGERA